MLADEHPEIRALSPKTIGGSPVSIHLYVEDVDTTVARAVAAGAKLIRPMADQFYGDRTGGIEEPFGYRWFIADSQGGPDGERDPSARCGAGRELRLVV
jgi:PhnB protein